MFLFQTDSPISLPAGDVKNIEEQTKGLFDSFKGLSLDDAVSKLANDFISFGIKLVVALVIFYVGRFIIKRIYKTTQNIMLRRDVDASLTTFVLSLIKITLYFILIVTVIGILGIETSSFIALFASAGVAVGMALSGTLQNFAGGVLILLLKPYKVGDYIEAQGYAGTVKAINIFNTIINTPDNKSIIIPNGGLSTSSVNNYSLEGYRRVDWTVGLSYSTDFDAAKDCILAMIAEDKRVVTKYLEDDREMRLRQQLDDDRALLKKMEDSGDSTQKALDEQRERISTEAQAMGETKLAEEIAVKRPWWKRLFGRKVAKDSSLMQLKSKLIRTAGVPVKADCSPFVGLMEMADSSINIVVRAWTPSNEYWGLYFDMNRRFYVELPKHGFEFPFPQMDVHLQK